ncbi:hypothetical protein DM02DRAFT_665262, partial [Periconia macrospinosa]
PLDLDGPRFIYQEAGLPSVASPSNHDIGSPALPTEPLDFPLFPSEIPVAEDQKSHSVAAPSESASTTLAKDSAMNRMVDDLVGVDDGLDPLPEEDENVPPTPPEQTFEDTALVPGAIYGLATFSINDLVNSVQNYEKASGSPAPGIPLLSTPMNRVASSSSVRGPATLPSLPDGQSNSASIWNRNYGTPAPASPLMLNNPDMRSSPLNVQSYSHVRGDSANSARSYDYSIGSTLGTRPISGGLGNGATWGTSTVSSSWNSIYDNGNHNANGMYANEYTKDNTYNYDHGFNATTELNLMGSMGWNSQYAEQHTARADGNMIKEQCDIYGSIVWTAPDIAFYMWCETFPLLLFLLIAGMDDFFPEYAMLSRIAMASVVSWALWNEALQKHLGSGNPIPERVRTLRWFVAANALAASFQILGAVLQYSLSFANVQTSEIRQGIVFVRLHFLRAPSLT